MKIATWNVNSLRVRLPHVLEWLEREQPDVLALQEIKMVDADFPAEEFTRRGYHFAVSGQKTYNGVATLSRAPLEGLVRDLPGFEDSQRRVLGADTADVTVLNLYVPNGSAVGSEKYEYKLAWLGHLQHFVAALLARHENLVLLGDFNIAPADRDVHDPEAWRGQVLCSEPEREQFARLTHAGLVDCFRLVEPERPGFTWWDYRAAAFRRDRGLRIDHILASPALASRCADCRVDRAPRALERPSDHAPLVAEFGG